MSARPDAAPAPSFWWARDDLGYVGGRLHLAGCDVAAAAAEVDGPLFLYSAARVRANLARLQAALALTARPSRVYYAMKCSRFVPLLESLRGQCGIDICSPNELDRALACGFAARDISFTGTGVSNRDLDRLLAEPDLNINCDTVGMIRRIGERAPGRAIGVRVNPARGVGYSERLVYAGDEVTKFGIYREQWPEALATARQYGLTIRTLHFHVGCGYLDPQLESWEAALAGGLAFAEDLPDLTTVNIGGGLGLPQQAGDAPLDLARWATVLRQRFAGRAVTIAVEPGDYIVKDAGLLVLEATDVEVKRDVEFVQVNGGFNLHPEPAHYDRPCEPVACVPSTFDERDWRPVTVSGNINEALDVWARGHRMPPMAGGDHIAFLNTGGYGASMSSNHCMRGDLTERLLP